jgi:predicted CoA-binding protein
VRRFVADVLAENSRMWQVITDCGLPVRRRVGGGEVHIELDLTPAEGYLVALAERAERADVASLSAVLAARSIVVVGAGRRPDSVGHVVLESLVQAGFTGQLAAVNPHAGQVCGVTCHRSIEDVPGPVDLAVLCRPAEVVPEVARQCGRAGVRALLVISSGLSGLPVLGTVLAADAEQAVAAFTAAGRPVAVKAVADGVLHTRLQPAGCASVSPTGRRSPRPRPRWPPASGRGCAGCSCNRWRRPVPNCWSGWSVTRCSARWSRSASVAPPRIWSPTGHTGSCR